MCFQNIIEEEYEVSCCGEPEKDLLITIKVLYIMTVSFNMTRDFVFSFSSAPSCEVEVVPANEGAAACPRQ